MIGSLQVEAREVSLIEPLAVRCETCDKILRCPVWRMKINPGADLPCKRGVNEEEYING